MASMTPSLCKSSSSHILCRSPVLRPIAVRTATRRRLVQQRCSFFSRSDPCESFGCASKSFSSESRRPGGIVTSAAKNMTAPSSQSSSSLWSEHAKRAVNALTCAGVECVAFDMDQTIISKHSRGSLKRTQFTWFCDHATPAFIALVPELKKAGIKMAIATASDVEEYRPHARYPFRKTPETHMLGEDLVVPLLKRIIPDYADDFYIVAYNPKARGAEGKLPENQGKRKHIRDISIHFNILEENMLLFDDESGNHRAHKLYGAKFYSVKVKRHGLELPIMVQQLEQLSPEQRIVDLPHSHRHG